MCRPVSCFHLRSEVVGCHQLADGSVLTSISFQNTSLVWCCQLFPGDTCNAMQPPSLILTNETGPSLQETHLTSHEWFGIQCIVNVCFAI